MIHSCIQLHPAFCEYSKYSIDKDLYLRKNKIRNCSWQIVVGQLSGKMQIKFFNKIYIIYRNNFLKKKTDTTKTCNVIKCYEYFYILGSKKERSWEVMKLTLRYRRAILQIKSWHLNLRFSEEAKTIKFSISTHLKSSKQVISPFSPSSSKLHASRHLLPKYAIVSASGSNSKHDRNTTDA